MPTVPTAPATLQPAIRRNANRRETGSGVIREREGRLLAGGRA